MNIYQMARQRMEGAQPGTARAGERHQAFDGLASENGMPKIDWEYKYEEEEEA